MGYFRRWIVAVAGAFAVLSCTTAWLMPGDLLWLAALIGLELYGLVTTLVMSLLLAEAYREEQPEDPITNAELIGKYWRLELGRQTLCRIGWHQVEKDAPGYCFRCATVLNPSEDGTPRTWLTFGVSMKDGS